MINFNFYPYKFNYYIMINTFCLKPEKIKIPKILYLNKRNIYNYIR